MRKRRKKAVIEDVELNLAAMLDMAFQLLTFFILTFKPSPIEGQFLLHLPPAQAVTKAQEQIAKASPTNKNLVQGFASLVITAYADDSGGLRGMKVGENAPGSLDALDKLLVDLVGGFGFDQVIIEVDSKLHYEWVMKIIGVVTKQELPDGEKISKLSFVQI